uniref:Fibrinogen-like protein 1 n=1 Tax=Phascolarctos cinereus TaxID=38626 RepID=A0A6P5JDN9_PHACI|nr:fibrinogen-like protein 1 isoform X3 [Phascolarctos cinereus]
MKRASPALGDGGSTQTARRCSMMATDSAVSTESSPCRAPKSSLLSVTWRTEEAGRWCRGAPMARKTLTGDYTLKIELADFEGEHRFAQYESFRVGGEKSAYELSFREYSGTAGDSLAGSFHPEVQWWASHLRMKFSTRDRDNDNYSGNCAKEDRAGWWYNSLVSRKREEDSGNAGLRQSQVIPKPAGGPPSTSCSGPGESTKVSLGKPQRSVLQRGLHRRNGQRHRLVHLARVVVFSEVCRHEDQAQQLCGECRLGVHRKRSFLPHHSR